ncbi:hypothetical protein J5X84_29885 [Streptosporangiaceae bacterium NEAU-GS5]|nr:hypothetical protein [Streptosporangiaceae bacterium NEAU-GS5]
MVISVSVVLLLGVAVVLALRYTRLALWHAVVCVLFGFYLSQTAAAPEVQRMVSTIVRAISGNT